MSSGSANSLRASALAGREFTQRRITQSVTKATLSLNAMLIFLTAIAVGGSGYLAYVALAAGTVAGCGNDAIFDCSHVLSSRWSSIVGIPVSIPAVLLHTVVLGLLLTPAHFHRITAFRWPLITLAEFTAAFGALWFIGLQLFVLQHLCFYCLAVHSCALMMAGLILWQCPAGKAKTLSLAIVAIVQVIVFAATQTLADAPEKFQMVEIEASPQRPEPTNPAQRNISDGESARELDGRDLNREPVLHDENIFEAPTVTPMSMQLEDMQSAVAQFGIFFMPHITLMGQVTTQSQSSNTQTPSEAAQANAPQKERRTVTILNGLALDVKQWPLLGKSNADFVVVEMLDYTCIHCQNTHAAVHGAREQMGDRLAVIVLPIPLNANCNHHVRTTHVDHTEACDLAKLAIAVWRTRNDSFEEFHGWLLTNKPRFAQAYLRAVEICGEQQLRKELDSGIPAAFIAKNVKLYERAQAGALPKILFPTTAAVGEMRSANTLISLIENNAGP